MDSGPKKIDFGEGTATPTPAPSSVSSKRPDSERCYSEYTSFNEGANPAGLGMDISSKHNGGEKA